MNTVHETAYDVEIAEAHAGHPAGTVDLTAELPGERFGMQAKSGAVKTLTISYWHCC